MTELRAVTADIIIKLDPPLESTLNDGTPVLVRALRLYADDGGRGFRLQSYKGSVALRRSRDSTMWRKAFHYADDLMLTPELERKIDEAMSMTQANTVARNS